MKLELDWLKLTGSRSIFIRGGESGFMTYCVKTQRSKEDGSSLANSQVRKGGLPPLQRSVLSLAMRTAAVV